MCSVLFILFASFERDLPNGGGGGGGGGGGAGGGNERVYVLQNSAYRLQGVGIGKAVDVIQKMGLPEEKSCRIIVLDNNVPQISL